MKQRRPPGFAKRLVEWYCKSSLAEDLLGDLEEYFERNVESKGLTRARLIYIVDAIKFLRPYTIKTPKALQPLIHWIMIGSYFKTSGRNMLRNKLFSTINVIGLAISMSVGLLMIAFLKDVLSFDRFNDKASRMYRVITTPTSLEGYNWNRFASTSIRAGQLVREKVSGIEEVTIMVGGAQKDARVDDQTIPISGYYADPSSLRVFTFPLISGNKTTALKEPHSIVLTKKSAKKLFGREDVLDRAVTIDNHEYRVTGVMEDIPFYSHIKFEALLSLESFFVDNKDDSYQLKWVNIWQNFVYVVASEGADTKHIQKQFDDIAAEENVGEKTMTIELALQPITEIVLGPDLSNGNSPRMTPETVWIVGSLACVVILSACFNYTNLSIARSMRRFKEVGVRKVIGAGKSHVRQQFVVEAILISLAALILSFGLFLIMREQITTLIPNLSRLVQLKLTPVLVLAFVVFAMAVGILAGILPAVFFARIGIIQALRDSGAVKVFANLNMRRVLVLVQYTATLIFITTTVVGYKQYQGMLSYDLGYRTSNIFTIRMQNNETPELVRKLSAMPEVGMITHSTIVTSIGDYYSDWLKRPATGDSVEIGYNKVDENYFPLLGHKFLAGGNFKTIPNTEDAVSEIIITEKTMNELKIGGGDPLKAIGEQLTFEKRNLSVVGVLKDFHYSTVRGNIDPIGFTYLVNKKDGVLSFEVQSDDILASRAKLEETWKEFDGVHPFEGAFYEQVFEDTYSQVNAMLTVVGCLAFLAISIASMGMFGMVVFTTETKLKEISIRKVLGASSGSLIYLMGRGFVALLGIAAVIAIPATWLLFDKFLLTTVPYHAPIGVFELVAGLIGVMIMVCAMIGTQTLKAARSNPAEVLKNE